jgi:hypothetical protein
MLHIQACELALSDGQAPIIQNAALDINPRACPNPRHQFFPTAKRQSFRILNSVSFQLAETVVPT